MDDNQTGAYLRRREKKVARRAKALSTTECAKLLIQAKRLYQKSNYHIFTA